MLNRVAVVAVAVLLLPSVVAAQQASVYVGGALNLMTQTHADGLTEPLGGTTRGASAVFGVQLSRRVAVEFEPSFGGPHSYTYTYRPGPTSIADVVVRRHDSFYSFQVRTRMGVFEPVAGVSYVHGPIRRVATLRQGTPYFDDRAADHGVAAVGGLDAAIKCASHFYFVPTFRLFARFSNSGDHPLDAQTLTGAFTFRCGAGVRVTF